MRRAFIDALTALAAHDERIVLLTGDLGFTVVEPFAERFPTRFFNVGVAEQDMVGLATGLAEAGLIPFTYSIATFASMRAYEFVRNGPVLHRLPVRIVGVGGGFEYGHAGPTHHSVEDVALMRALPGMAVLVPADHEQAVAALAASCDVAGPVYFRLGKEERRTVPGLHGRFALGGAEIVREGRHLAIVSMGAITFEAVAAAEELSAEGLEATVIVVASVAPAPVNGLADALVPFPLVLTVEAHSVVGGVGSLVCELVAELGLGSRVIRCGVRGPAGLGGDEAYLNSRHGLSHAALADTARRAVAGAPLPLPPGGTA